MFPPGVFTAQTYVSPDYEGSQSAITVDGKEEVDLFSRRTMVRIWDMFQTHTDTRNRMRTCIS